MATDDFKARFGDLSRNGLQTVAAIVRMEARNVRRLDDSAKEHCPMEQLADRLDTIVLTYKQVDPVGADYSVQLGPCIEAVVAERIANIERKDQITSNLRSITLSLDHAIPVMLLFAEILGKVEEADSDVILKKIVISQDQDKVVKITQRFDREIQNFQEIERSQLIELLIRQVGAKLSNIDSEIQFEFGL